jgi:putative ABC transport system ATP-binding protein
MSDSTNLIRLVGVSRIYRNHVPVPALRGVSLSIDSGEFVAAVGPSGSGKTTLLNLIGGLDRPDEGSITVAGLELEAASPDTLAGYRLGHVGFVFQSFNLFPVLSVLENLEFVPALRGVAKLERRRRAESLLATVGMGDLAAKRPAELSGGQQQRVAVLRAIVSEPDLVLADEPTANLDSQNASLLLDFMEDLNRSRGITFLFSTHDPMVMQRARRLLRLKDGRLIDGEEPRNA